MIGIVERLRANGQSPWLAGMYRYVDDRRVSVRDDCAEAADEIERLRAENARLIELDTAETRLTDRLRGLLREAREDWIKVGYGASHEDVAACRDFCARIDAALGPQPTVTAAEDKP